MIIYIYIINGSPDVPTLVQVLGVPSETPWWLQDVRGGPKPLTEDRVRLKSGSTQYYLNIARASSVAAVASGRTSAM